MREALDEMNNKTKESPNLYLLAFFTALFAGLFSIVGNYYLSKDQIKQVLPEKDLDLRKEVYLSFLSKIDKSNDPVISEMLNIGPFADKVGTDSQIQDLEDKLHNILSRNDTYDIYWRLNSDLNILRLRASDRVKIRADDLLNALSLNFDAIQIKNHSAEVQAYYKKWWEIQREGIPYGFEEKITLEERFSIIISGKLLQSLIQAMNEEINTTSS